MVARHALSICTAPDICNSVQDFGPAHTFWCFEFEQMNGVLGSFSINNCSIEMELMRRCVDSVQFATVAQSIDDNDFKTIYNALLKSNKDVHGTANSVLYAHVQALTSSNAGEFVFKNIIAWWISVVLSSRKF